MDALIQYKRRIGEITPEVVIESIRLSSEGLFNDIVIVNEDLVFRFPKNEYAFRHLNDEVRILRLLQNQVSLEIPRPAYIGADVMVYRMISGEPLRRDLVMKLAEDDQQAIGDQLAEFLKELHNVPILRGPECDIPMADSLMRYEGWVRLYSRIRDKVFPLLVQYVREWAVEHFESYLAEPANFEYDVKMVDTDLAPYHILFDQATKRISGVIDFGCAGLGDPALDLGVLIYHYGESFADRLYRVYPEAESFLKRARFYAGAQEMRWLLTGLERGDPFWFAVHIGGAKDLRYNG
jgi:aminoglycoside 2''-phosphotransferase